MAAELIYGAMSGVTVRYQSEDGQWSESATFGGFEPVGWTDSMVVADVDGNGHEDLLVIAADALRVFDSDEGALQQPGRFHINGNPQSCRGMSREMACWMYST